MLMFNTWGLLNTFGAFQTYYESGELFAASSSDISWIGSIQSYMLLLTGLFAGPIYDRGYLRTLLFVGSFGIVFGHMMLSISTTYWEVLLAQGFCIGIGAGCLFVPCVSIMPTYFSTRLGLAVGIASSGSSFGGVIYPIVLYRLLDQVGFGWATRIMGFLTFATLLIPLTVMKMRVKAPKARALIDWSGFIDVPYMTFIVATLIAYIGLFVLLFYISYNAENRHITDTSLAFYLIPVFNSASIFGRVLPNALSDKTGVFNLIVPGTLISGVLILCMIAATSEGAIIVLAILSGFFSGLLIALPPVCIVRLTQDKTKIGTRIGMGYAIIAFGTLAAGPGAGHILGTTDPLNWNGLWIYAGVTSCVGGILYAGLRVAKFGFKLNVKA